jgi:hypothetical protein
VFPSDTADLVSCRSEHEIGCQGAVLQRKAGPILVAHPPPTGREIWLEKRNWRAWAAGRRRSTMPRRYCIDPKSQAEAEKEKRLLADMDGAVAAAERRAMSSDVVTAQCVRGGCQRTPVRSRAGPEWALGSARFSLKIYYHSNYRSWALVARLGGDTALAGGQLKGCGFEKRWAGTPRGTGSSKGTRVFEGPVEHLALGVKIAPRSRQATHAGLPEASQKVVGPWLCSAAGQ